jgi:hypothetical protein
LTSLQSPAQPSRRLLDDPSDHAAAAAGPHSLDPGCRPVLRDPSYVWSDRSLGSSGCGLFNHRVIARLVGGLPRAPPRRARGRRRIEVDPRAPPIRAPRSSAKSFRIERRVIPRTLTAAGIVTVAGSACSSRRPRQPLQPRQEC